MSIISVLSTLHHVVLITYRLETITSTDQLCLGYLLFDVVLFCFVLGFFCFFLFLFFFGGEGSFNL